MYYHIKISTNSGQYLTEVKADLSEEQLNDRFLSRIKEEKNLTINGRSVKLSEIVKVQIYQSEENTNNIINEMKLHGGWEFTEDEILRDIAVKNCDEITDDILKYPEEISPKNSDEEKIGESQSNKDVFIVHGHDKELKNEVMTFIYSCKLNPIVLHGKPDQGLTIIEKFEKYSNVKYAIILATPDDTVISDKKIDSKNIESINWESEKRARQNVIFEFGYFVGKLGRNHVCCLYKGDVTLPNDIDGVIYKDINDGFDKKKLELIQELKSAGLDVNV